MDASGLGMLQMSANLLQVLQLLSQPLDFAVYVMTRLSPGLLIVIYNSGAVYLAGVQDHASWGAVKDRVGLQD